MALRLLAVGDIHLGRWPSRLPDELAPQGRALAPADAWQRLIDRAIDESVDIVALAGDVVEREDDYYEAYRELSDGVGRLAAAGIPVVGVSGNHDVRVLPRLAERLDGFRLLGRGGEWESIEASADGETVTLHGWSFRQEQVRRSPLEGIRLQRRAGVNIGLLHCDRDQPHSAYAPVTSSELRAADLDGWLLGHIHVPDALATTNLTGYLGSVSGMDPGEPGDHGPWLLTIAGNRVQCVEHWVLAPLRWEALDLVLTDMAEPEEARARLIDAVTALDATIARKTQPPEAVGLRVRLTGRTAFGRQVRELLQQNEQAIIHDGLSGTRYFIERSVVHARPAVSLAKLAQRSDPPGLLARRLSLLENPEHDEARQLIVDARERLDKQCRDPRWQGLHPEPLTDADVIGWLRLSGMRLLEDMLDQHSEGQP